VRAEERLRQAVAIDGEYALAWLGLGKALAARKKADEAERAFRRAAELSAGSWEARLGVADFLIRRGELEQAKEVCAAAARASPDVAAVYLKLAEISAKQRHWDESLAHCETARRLAPYTHPPKVLLAVFCCADGEPDRGVRLLQEARAEAPAHPMPPLILGQLTRRQRQFGPAREYYAAAAALPVPDNWPDSHRQRFLVLLHSERFQLAQQLQDAALARDALAEWLKVEPTNARVRKMYDDLVSGAGP
jgi:tetratricopeptide (TPR) repeat protein